MLSTRLARVATLTAATFATVLLLSAAAHAEWDRQRMNPMDQDKGFLAICAVSDTFAVAAGVIKQGSSENGAVVVTRDGMNWAVSSPVTGGGPLDMHVYMSCYFPDEQHGYVGGVGEIWTTEDGAASWTKVGLGGLFSGRQINGITGLGTGEPAFAVTSVGQVLKTTDGVDWPELARPLGDVNLGAVVFTDSDHGWVSGGAPEANDEGEVLGYHDGGLALTTDGGDTWQVVFEGEERAVMRLHFVTNSIGWMLSTSMNGAVLEHTTDGGLTWAPVVLPSESMGGTIVGFNDIHFFDGCEGMLLGALQDNDWGAAWRTIDGGATWVEFDRAFLALGQVLGITIESTLITFDFADRGVGWATGSNETIFRYDAEDDPPTCEGGGDGDADGDSDGDGDDDSPSERCTCRAAGATSSSAVVTSLTALLLGAVWLSRRAWRR